MNFFHFAFLALVLVFVVLGLHSKKRAWKYARWTLISLAALVVLSPFAWLLAAIFKDRSVLNEYVFFPPPGKWGSTLNLNNFRDLFQGRPSLRGTVFFWEYFLNSTIYATVATTLQIFFSSMAGFALAKYEFRGKVRAHFVHAWIHDDSRAFCLLAPLYKMVVDLGFVDSLAGLILPGRW
jgi:multiple sugar transport system permease protein